MRHSKINKYDQIYDNEIQSITIIMIRIRIIMMFITMGRLMMITVIAIRIDIYMCVCVCVICIYDTYMDNYIFSWVNQLYDRQCSMAMSKYKGVSM